MDKGILRFDDFDKGFVLELSILEPDLFKAFFFEEKWPSYYVPFVFRYKHEQDCLLHYQGVDYVRVMVASDRVIFRTLWFMCERFEKEQYLPVIRGIARRVEYRKCFAGTANPRKKK